MELWKDIPGYGGHYQASNEGRIRSRDRVIRKFSVLVGKAVNQNYKGRFLSGSFDANGYVKVHLGVDGKKYVVQVGRLVLMAFVGPQPEGMECCHCNGDSSDNRVENLRWDTHHNNNQDRIKHGTYACGEDHHGSKLKKHEVLEIYNSNESGIDLAEKFGIHPTQISGIRLGQIWSSVTGGAPRKVKMKMRRTDKIGWDGARDIRKKFEGGESKQSLAEKYGVGIGAIQDVVMNRKWVE